MKKKYQISLILFIYSGIVINQVTPLLEEIRIFLGIIIENIKKKGSLNKAEIIGITEKMIAKS